MKKLAKIFLLLPLFLLCLSAEAQACGCIMSFVQYQPCGAYWNSDTVFTGTVVDVGPMIPVDGSGGKAFSTNGRYTRFKVEQGFRGVQGETIDTYEHGTSCDYHFKLGESYFVYGSRDPKDGKIYVSSCSATKTLERAEPDIAYARGVLRGDPTPSIIGLITRETRKQASEYRQNILLEGIRVTADGGLKTRVDLVPVDSDGKEITPAEQSIQTYSDDQGRYRFDWLAPGRYLVTVNSHSQPASYDPPYQRTYYPGVTERARASVLEVIDGQQLTVDDFAIGPPLQTRTIEGVVLMPDGTPAANALVTLEFTERNWAEIGSADAQGRFSLKVYDGFKYIVAAEVRKEVQGVWRGTHSAGVEVTVGAINQAITLTISRPGFYRPRYAQPR